jgi:hypothetical protein
MQYALLYCVAGLSVARETIAAPVTSSALTGLMQNRAAPILRYYIRAHTPQSVWGAREPSCLFWIRPQTRIVSSIDLEFM